MPHRVALLLALVLCSAGGCLIGPPALQPGPVPSSAADLPAALEAHTGAPVIRGNALTVLQNGDEIFPALLAALREARERIALEQYTWEEGAGGRDIAAALAERAAAGVDVRVLLDAFGSRRIPPADLAAMRAAGCQVVFVRPLRQVLTLNRRDHRRLVLVDGRVAFAGDVGFGENWTGNGRTPGRWRTTHARVEGPVVAHLERDFTEQWAEATGRPVIADHHPPAGSPAAGSASVQVIRGEPLRDRFDVYTMFRLAAAAARRSLFITGPYFLPDEALREELRRAARRGVRVVLLGPGPTDRNLVRSLSRRELAGLIRDGVEVYEYLPARLHTKSFIVDGSWATIGSANIDNRSFALNAELNLAVADPGVARRLADALAEDLTYSRRIDDARWRARGFQPRLLEWLALPLRPWL